jgi:ABC-type transport system substrate-binding protein/methyl-accepting chemotaxis protein
VSELYVDNVRYLCTMMTEARIAQLVEHRTENPGVPSSILGPGIFILTITLNSIQLFDMTQGLRETILSRIKPSLEKYNDAFTHLVDVGHRDEKVLEKDTDILSDIRRKFDNLSAAVELEFEGTSVFDQEIKRTKELLEQSIAKVHESRAVASQISKDLNNISASFDKIHADGVLLEGIIKDINEVSDSIEVASRNAGITAYHAGKQGRGFEVIAREMTALVRRVQHPTQQIPEISHEIVEQSAELGQNLVIVDNLMQDLKDTDDKFSRITDELLGLIPNIEAGIQDIGNSVVSQKELHKILLSENEKSHNWVIDLYEISRTAAVLEISLEAMSRHVNNLREVLYSVDDNASFVSTFNAMKIALENARTRYRSITSETKMQEVSKLEVQSSERSIIQLVSESNQLYATIERISMDIARWLKTNGLAKDVLSNSVDLYNEITSILSQLRKKLSVIQHISGKIEKPLYDLHKITERSKVLGLYAGIESARGGTYASSLGVVTKEIQDLSKKTMLFVGKIGEVSNDIEVSFSELSSHLIKSISDVEQGIGSLMSATKILKENKDVLENLTRLSQEMIESTEMMKEHCSELRDQIKILNSDYNDIKQNFKEYYNTISDSTSASEQILTVLDDHASEVNVIARNKKTIIFRQNIEPIILDPAYKTDAQSHQIIEQVFTGLLTFDSANNLIPGIAESFSVSKDGCVWDFTLKPDVHFHNGDVVTAQHIVSTIERVMNGPNAGFIDYIGRVIETSEGSVRFTLKFPYLPFLANLACGVCDITLSQFSTDNIIGAGPYRFVRWDKGSEIVLDANGDFFDGCPAIDRIIIKFIQDNREAVARFRRGELSLLQVTPDMFKDFDRAELVSGATLSTQYVHIHVSQDTPFKNKLVRQAMNFAVDKRAYAMHAYQGQGLPSHGVFPPGMYSYNEDLAGYPYDLDKARELMKEAGHPHGVDQTFILDVRDDGTTIERAKFIKESLARIGIEIDVNAIPWKELLEKGYRGDSSLCLKSWVSDNGDPDNFLFPLFHTKSFGRPGNTSFYSNHTVDTMIEQARSERNSTRRRKIYHEVERIIVDDAPWIFLSHGVDTYAVGKDLGGFRVDPFGIVRFRFLWGR